MPETNITDNIKIYHKDILNFPKVFYLGFLAFLFGPGGLHISMLHSIQDFSELKHIANEKVILGRVKEKLIIYL